MTRRSRLTKLAAWTCLLAVVLVAATGWSAAVVLPPPVVALFDLPEPPSAPFAAPDVACPESHRLPTDAGRAPPRS